MPTSSTITVHVPYLLRTYCDGRAELSLAATNVRDALQVLEQKHPTLYGCICDETGAIRRHVNLFINDSHIRARDGINSALEPGDVLVVLPAVSGG